MSHRAPSLHGTHAETRSIRSAAWEFARAATDGAAGYTRGPSRIAYLWIVACAPIDVPAEVREEAWLEFVWRVAMSGRLRGLARCPRTVSLGVEDLNVLAPLAAARFLPTASSQEPAAGAPRRRVPLFHPAPGQLALALASGGN